MQQFLGIDFGTSALKAVVIDDQANPVASGRVALPAPARAGNRVTGEPESWWRQLCVLFDQLVLDTPLDQLRAIAVDGTSATVLATDASGAPSSAALMYSDARAEEEAQRIAAVAPGSTGAAGAGSSLAKLLYLRRHTAHDRFMHLQHQADWILGRLSGRPDVTDENHALKLGYDPLRREWPDWLETLDFPHHLLPHVVPAGTAIGTLRGSLARRWHLPDDVAIVAGTTDSTAACIASGADRTGDAVTSLGSTLVVKVLSDHPVFSPVYGVYSHRLENRWLVGGASNTGGAALGQFFDDQTLATLSLEIDPRHPVCLDYYPLPGRGERFPVNDPGLESRVSPRPRDDRRFLQGLLQGIARVEQQGYRLLHRLSAPYPGRVFTAGGGAGNPAWTEIRRRTLRRPVLPAQHQEAAYGTALLARRACNVT